LVTYQVGRPLSQRVLRTQEALRHDHDPTNERP